MVVGILFLLALFFTPLAGMVPSVATAPALIIVGVLMMGAITGINFDDFTEAFPAFLTIAFMPFAYSIASGIAIGFISYPIVKLVSGKGKELNWFIYILAQSPWSTSSPASYPSKERPAFAGLSLFA